jgi:hypothetical protein
MKSFTVMLSMNLLLGVALVPIAIAQEITGTPGSPPSATTTIDGEQLPPPPPKFGAPLGGTTVGGHHGFEPLASSAIVPGVFWTGDRVIARIAGCHFADLVRNQPNDGYNTPSFQYSAAGPFDQWPSGMGLSGIGPIALREMPVLRRG